VRRTGFGVGVGVARGFTVVLRRGRESWLFVSNAAKARADFKGPTTATAQAVARTRPATIKILLCSKLRFKLFIPPRKAFIIKTQPT
jgi:hypothetical protein